MALTEYVMMPGEDYQAACDMLRSKTGKTDLIKSGDLEAEIEGLFAGEIVEKSVEADFSTGNMEVAGGDGEYMSKVTVVKPGTLVPENIVKNVNIGGVVGTYTEDDDEDPTPYAWMARRCTYFNTQARQRVYSLPTLKITVPSCATIGAYAGGFSYSSVNYSYNLSFASIGTYDFSVCSIETAGSSTVVSYGGFSVDFGYSNYHCVGQELWTGFTMPGVYIKRDDTGTTLRCTADAFVLPANYPVSAAIDSIDMTSANIQSLPAYCFSDVTTLRTIHWPRSLHTIGTGVFHHCTSLQSIYGLDAITSMGNNVFQSCYDLNSVVIDGAMETLPAGAFDNCSKLSYVQIPDSIKTIGSSAFRSTAIQSIALPSALSTIGNDAFLSCTKLQSIHLPNGVMSIGSSAFGGCRSLLSVTLNQGISSMGKSAFAWCGKIQSIVLPNMLVSIPDYAFYCCSSMSSVEFGSSVISIGGYAFYGCPLSNVLFPDTVESMGSWAFYKAALASVIIPAKMTAIASNCFAYCSSLSTVVLPTGITTIAYGAFSSCTSLSSINFPESLSVISGYAFCRCAFSEVDLGFTAVASIGGSAFASCPQLETVILPSTCSTIGASAFASCVKLTSIEIPYQSVVTLSTNVFISTPMSLSTLTGSFGSIFVPESLVSQYAVANNWSAYSARIVAIPGASDT